MANEMGGGSGTLIAMMMIATIAFLGFLFIKKKDAAAGITSAATQPSTTTSTTVISPVLGGVYPLGFYPFSGPVIFVDDEPDFDFRENPCHWFRGARWSPHDRKCFFPFHRDCDDRDEVWDGERCFRPEFRVRHHEPINIVIRGDEHEDDDARRNRLGFPSQRDGPSRRDLGDRVMDRGNAPSTSFNFKTPDGKNVGPDKVVTFASNCRSKLGQDDKECGQMRTVCASGQATNKDVCTALSDAGFT